MAGSRTLLLLLLTLTLAACSTSSESSAGKGGTTTTRKPETTSAHAATVSAACDPAMKKVQQAARSDAPDAVLGAAQDAPLTACTSPAEWKLAASRYQIPVGN